MPPLTALVIASLFAQEPSAPDRFDLVCTNIRDIVERRPEPKPDIRFRVDLVDSRYCVGPCTDVRRLTVYSDTLVFTQTDLTAGAPFAARQSVDRHTGEYTLAFIQNGRITQDDRGSCVLAPYTGTIRGERLF